MNFKRQGKKPVCEDRRQLLISGAGVLFTGAFLPYGIAFAQSIPENSQGAVAILEDFLKNITSMTANFVQVVKTPSAERTRTSSGVFMLARPNRFRFDYLKPYEQQIISDGVDLWLYDKDLEQVTQRSYSASIASTPAALLAGGAEATMKQKNFILSNLPETDGIQWVEAKPKQEDGLIESARIGFRNNVLAVLEITDNFRQQSTLTFSDVQVNVNIPDVTFEFVVPKDVDLITE